MKQFIKKKINSYQKAKLIYVYNKFRSFFYKKNIGKNTYIDKSVKVLGWKSITIGENNVIGAHSWLNINYKIKDFKHITIANNCYIGKRVFISSGEKIVIKDYCVIGDDCKIIGSNHIYDNPMIPYAFSGASHEEVINIGVNVWLGTMICVLGNVSIGYGSIIGAGSVVNRSIPPFSIVVGNPCKIIKRYDFRYNKWISIDEWEESFTGYFPSESEYLKQMQSNTLDTQQYRYAASYNVANLI